jgi:regulator of sigma E protease
MLAAMDLATVAYWTWIVIKVAIALGAVIFVHELGHFLAAKACGVKVEKFFVGFDIGGYKISRRRGETEYGVGILPLGGYVKMLGQDDDPAHIAEQMQKSQVDARSPDAVEVNGPGGEKYFVDHRSYLAKNVPQRMLIISAGVVMNVIFAFIFAVVAYGMGVPYTPAIVSETVPGAPAWVQGLEPGDVILQIGKREDPTVKQLQGDITLASQTDGLLCRVKRAATGEVEEVRLTPDRGRSRLGTIGVIFGPVELTLRKEQPTLEDSPAAAAKLVAPAEPEILWGNARLAGGDQIIRVNDAPVSSYRELAAEMVRHPDRPLSIVVRRSEPVKNGGEPTTPPKTQDLTFEIASAPLKRLGIAMKMGPIAAIQIGSPAESAGLKPGDVIEAVDGQSANDPAGAWDSFTLPEYFRHAADAGRQIAVDVLRGEVEGESPQKLSLRLTPRLEGMFPSEPLGRAPLAIPAAGFAYPIENEVLGVISGGSDAQADIQPGDTISVFEFKFPNGLDSRFEGVQKADLENNKVAWPTLLAAMQLAPPGTKVKLTVKSSDNAAAKIVEITPAQAGNLFAVDRGFLFQPVERIRKANDFAQQLRFGRAETVDSLLMVYRFLHKLGDEVPLTALGGPITIAKVAGMQAAEGLSQLLIFLTMLSANLAVINFLPIPLLDGGHMVFLLYEGVRGRPANQRFVVAMHMIGFAFIVTLMLFVLGLDFGLIDRNL